MRRKDPKKTDQELVGDLDTYYYNNRDLKLLLDLLAEASGIDTSLRVLVLFDNEFSQKFKVGNLDISLVRYHKRKSSEVNFANYEEDTMTGHEEEQKVYDVSVEFEVAPAACDIISKFPNYVTYLYMVEIEPPTARSYVIPVLPGDYGTMPQEVETAIQVQQSDGGNNMGNTIEMEESNRKSLMPIRMKQVLFELEIAKEYLVHVSTIVNGRILARRTERIMPKSANDKNLLTVPSTAL